jgi:ADP-ribose pyrophosphatase YjhB (NUDIX family)
MQRPSRAKQNARLGNNKRKVFPMEKLPREFPFAPLVGVGAVIVHQDRVLLIRRGHEPLKGCWTLPGGLLELGESLIEGTIRETREETGLIVEPLELVELLDRIDRENGRIRFHYVIADYLCRVTGGQLSAASDALDARWLDRIEWNANNPLALDPVTIRVIEKGWRRAQSRCNVVQ